MPNQENLPAEIEANSILPKDFNTNSIEEIGFEISERVMEDRNIEKTKFHRIKAIKNLTKKSKDVFDNIRVSDDLLNGYDK